MAVLPPAQAAASASQRPDAARSRLEAKLGTGRGRAPKAQRPTQGAGGRSGQQRTAGLAGAGAAAVGVGATTPQVIESRYHITSLDPDPAPSLYPSPTPDPCSPHSSCHCDLWCSR